MKLTNSIACLLLILPILAQATIVRDANGKIARSRTEVARFKRMHPCPATGLPYGACRGWVIDHRIGLCVGGPDKTSNMRWMTVSNLQWQTIADGKAKDRIERKNCGV